jgi:hypothetical protein
MEIIKKIFMILGVIFIILILSIGIIVVIKPYGIDVIKTIPVILDKTSTSSYDHPYLTTQQESILESAGVDLEKVPTQITAEQQQCATTILGEERIKEIINGEMPSIVEVLKVKNCFE